VVFLEGAGFSEAAGSCLNVGSAQSERLLFGDAMVGSGQRPCENKLSWVL
jgi:hypothetical protein